MFSIGLIEEGVICSVVRKAVVALALIQEYVRRKNLLLWEHRHREQKPIVYVTMFHVSNAGRKKQC
jgi:hypothetical protein